MNSASITQRIRRVARDEALRRHRRELARFVSRLFSRTGQELHVAGHLLGSDRRNGVSPFGHGNDEVVAVSLLLRMGGQLIGASTELFSGGQHYAAAALLRQLVEIEYLSWAIETRNKDGERWLRSDRKEREEFFSPRKLRKAAQGRFRGEDYGYHCEFGGHPVPVGSILLSEDFATAELLLSDMLGHAGRIWNHLAGWALRERFATVITDNRPQMAGRFNDWASRDPLFKLPQPI